MEISSGLFVAQGAGLRMMADLALEMKVGRIGLFASHSQWYFDYLKEAPQIKHPPFSVVKEWEITQDPPALDMAILEHYDMLFGSGELWRALIVDRRMIMGASATLRQDYRRRFSDADLLRILQGHLLAFERLWQEIQPECVIAYNCVTVGDYLAYLFARQNGVPYLNLRATKIQDYVQYEPTPRQASGTILPLYRKRLQEGIDDRCTQVAREYVAQVRAQDALYEGVRKERIETLDLSKNYIALLTNVFKQEYAFRFGAVPRDNHVTSPVYSLLMTRVVNRLRAKRHDRALKSEHVFQDQLSSQEYVFFPLHSEPEVALLLNAKPYLNQIEVVRNLASSLPIGTKLFVKDHPLAYSRRRVKYYDKLLAIPNVRLIHPSVKSRPVIQAARAVVVITGSIGLEAAILGKPVITLAQPPYSLLPDRMVRYVTQLDALDRHLDDLMHNYSRDEDALVQLLATQVSLSASIKLYSVLLGRRHVVTTGESTYEDEIKKLAAYTERTLADPAFWPRSHNPQ
jgi:hypothetical protein